MCFGWQIRLFTKIHPFWIILLFLLILNRELPKSIFRGGRSVFFGLSLKWWLFTIRTWFFDRKLKTRSFGPIVNSIWIKHFKIPLCMSTRLEAFCHLKIFYFVDSFPTEATHLCRTLAHLGLFLLHRLFYYSYNHCAILILTSHKQKKNDHAKCWTKSWTKEFDVWME